MIFIFTPILGEMIQFDKHIFQMRSNHQLVWIFKRGFRYIVPGNWKLEMDTPRNGDFGKKGVIFQDKWFNLLVGIHVNFKGSSIFHVSQCDLPGIIFSPAFQMIAGEA